MPVWLNPLMLLGAVAAAAPIIIHLVMRKRARLVRFSRLLFMSELPRRSEGYFRLKQLLLLMLRIGCILLLAAAFARPYFSRKNATFSNESPAALFVLVDVSGSMAFQNRLTDVIEEVKDRIEELRPGDQAGLAVFDSSPHLVSELTENKSGVISLLEINAACTYEKTDIGAALQLASDMLADVQDRRRTILLASDLQQTGLQRLEENWRLPPGIKLEIIGAGGDAGNSCVAGAVVTSRSNSDDEKQSRIVRALVARYASSGSEEIDVDLEVNGRHIETQTVKVAAGQQRTVEFALPEAADDRVGRVRISEDDLDRDDIRHFVAPAPNKKQPVLILRAAAAEAPDEAMFPAAALGGGNPPEWDVIFAAPGDLAARKSMSYALVIVPGELDLDKASADWLANYAQSGGTVLIGADKQPLEKHNYCSPLADVEALGWVECDPDATVFQMLADYDVRHAVFAPFRGAQRGNFTAADFIGHERVNPGPAATVLAAFNDGSPALVERTLGKGRILLFTSSLGPRWNNLPYRGLYVAFIRSVARFASAGQETPDSYLVGATVLLQGPPRGATSVQTPDNKTHEISFDENGEAFYRQTGVPGIYKLLGDAPFSFSVNMDPEESNLESLPEEDLSFQISPESEDDTALIAGVTGELSGEESGRAAIYWKYLLLALLVLALGETVLANRTHR